MRGCKALAQRRKSDKLPVPTGASDPPQVPTGSVEGAREPYCALEHSPLLGAVKPPRPRIGAADVPPTTAAVEQPSVPNSVMERTRARGTVSSSIDSGHAAAAASAPMMGALPYRSALERPLVQRPSPVPVAAEDSTCNLTALAPRRPRFQALLYDGVLRGLRTAERGNSARRLPASADG